MTPAIIFENINVGCDLIELALETIGPNGTWNEFQIAIDGRVVPAGTTPRPNNGLAFEQVRNAYFAGEGLGRGLRNPASTMAALAVSSPANTRSCRSGRPPSVSGLRRRRSAHSTELPYWKFLTSVFSLSGFSNFGLPRGRWLARSTSLRRV